MKGERVLYVGTGSLFKAELLSKGDLKPG